MAAAKTENNSLRLGGDGDEIGLVQAIERAFGTAFENPDLAACLTVGDLHRLVLRATPHAERGNAACLSALAFYRLRPALAAHCPGAIVRPDTPIAALMQGETAGRFRARLQRKTKLSLPVPITSLATACLFLLTAATPFVGYHWWGGLCTLAVLPLALLTFLVGRFTARFPAATVGDLARQVGASNARRLLPEGAVMRDSEIWSSLVSIIRQETAWNGPITPETKLIG